MKVNVKFARKTLYFALGIALSVLLLSLSRVYFYFRYEELFADASSTQLFSAFLNGLRFDLSTSALILSVPALMLYAPYISRSQRLGAGVVHGMLLLYAAMIVYLMIDNEYYEYVQRHLTFELFYTWRESGVIFLIAAKKYALKLVIIALFAALMCITYIKGARRLMKFIQGSGANHKMGLIGETVLFLAVVIMTIILIRGGLQHKPIGISDAFSGDKTQLGHLALNGIYTTWRSAYYKDRGAVLNFVDDNVAIYKFTRMIINPETETPLDPEYPLLRRFNWADKDRRPLNVVVFVMESWAAKYTSADAVPFFNGLSKQGMYLDNCFANAQRSVEGMSSLMASMPPVGGMVLSKNAVLNQTSIKPLPSLLKDLGYSTIFLRGARYNSQGIGSFARQAGFERVISREDFGDEQGIDDGVWGVYDDVLFNRANKEFKAIERPFLAFIFPVSTHVPFVPKSDEFRRFGNEVPHGDFQNAMGYSDHSLKMFFDEARKTDYFKDTIFVIIADHTEGTVAAESTYSRFHIPCLFYAPDYIPPGVISSETSQIDVMPSILEMLRINSPHSSWGRSVFDDAELKRPGALLPMGESSGWARDGKILISRFGKPVSLYDYRSAPAVDVLDEHLQTADALFEDYISYLQSSNNMIVKNKVYPLK